MENRNIKKQNQKENNKTLHSCRLRSSVKRENRSSESGSSARRVGASQLHLLSLKDDVTVNFGAFKSFVVEEKKINRAFTFAADFFKSWAKVAVTV